ncbi:MAG TPA: hypothetical protein VK306_04195 [Acidimicrobiales bacterium]|nr:hypothetical protein [Acidimicrobiales bacterium]
MRLRRLVPALAAVTVAGLAPGGCAEQSAALRVGDHSVSEADLMDELDAWGGNEQYWTDVSQPVPEGELPDSWDQEFVSQTLSQRVQFLLIEDIFDERGLELTDDDRNAAEQGLGQQLGAAFDAFPDDLRADLVDVIARRNALVDELGQDGFQQALYEAVTGADISVASRFGHWDEDTLAVVPPDGSTPAAGVADDLGITPGTTG